MPKDFSTLHAGTPVIVGAGQYVHRLKGDSTPPFEPPMAIAAAAAQSAVKDAGVQAESIDTVAVVRLFSDAAPAWASPFGGSNNPPESLCRRIGANVEHRIYSNAGGTQPLQLLMELSLDVARGERELVLLAGAEAIANQRFAQRNGIEVDWNETFDEPFEDRQYKKRFASRQELHSGMFLPAHYYALIENRQAHTLGNNSQQHRAHMAHLMAPFSEVAAANPHAQFNRAYTENELSTVSRENYLISQPLSKLLIAQDAVNQGAALLLTSVGKARELGIDPANWVFLDAYAEGEDRHLSEREDIGRSVAMERVFNTTLDMAQTDSATLDLMDIYSCFPCAVHAAVEALGLTNTGRPLTVTGGLPYFGGPGNNYVMHALAEMVARLRSTKQRGLITANGGILSKHAAAVLSADPGCAAGIDWQQFNPPVIEPDTIPARQMALAPSAGRVVSDTVIAVRSDDDIGIVLCEDESGDRFLASSSDPAVTSQMLGNSTIGHRVSVSSEEERNYFSFVEA